MSIIYNLWNDNLEKVTGYSGAEIQQMNPLDFFAEDEKAKVHRRIQEVFDRGASEVEANFLTKSGHKIPHVFTGSRIEYAGVNYLVGVGLDITERKQSEIALNESEQRFRQITDNIKEVFLSKKMYLTPRSIASSVRISRNATSLPPVRFTGTGKAAQPAW